MRKNLKYVLGVLLMLALVSLMAMPTYAKKAAKPKLSATKVVLIKKDTTTLKVKNYKGSVKWKTSKKAVATVSTKGKITAKKAGKANITATCGGKKLTCKVTVEDPKMSLAKLSVEEGATATLALNGNTQKITWSSSNKSVATVANGVVTGVTAGTAKITAKVGKHKYTCTVTVTPGFSESDYSVVYGTKETYVEFKFDASEVTKAQLEEEGFTVENGVASKTCICDTATYTFKRLPKNLNELKKIKLDKMFGPMAATISILPTWEDMNAQQGGMYNHPIYSLFEYCQGGNAISNAQKSGVYFSMQGTLNKGKYCYFKGATPANKYTPNVPYTFTLVEGPYILPAVSTPFGNKPERHMVLIEFAGDDSQRYCDVYKSAKDGNWYCWLDQWCHLVSSIKDYETVWAPMK